MIGRGANAPYRAAWQRWLCRAYGRAGREGTNGAQQSATGFRAVTYHQMRDGSENPLTVPVAVFRDHVAEIGRRFAARSLGEIARMLEARKALPKRCVAVTVDDGYKNFVENAAPILAEQRVPAALFVITSMVGKKPYVDWADLRDLLRAGFIVGSHTCTHRAFSRLSAGEIREELAVSKAMLEDHLSAPVEFFSYPMGDVGRDVDTTREMVREAGYRAALTVRFGPNRRHEPRELWRRTTIRRGDSVEGLRAVLEGALDVLAPVQGFKQAVLGLCR